jgi:hypothetical protein
MHNMDRVQLESAWESPYGETGYGQETGYGAYETGYEQESPYGETYGETYGESYGETYGETYGEASFYEGPFSEAEEMELAVELLGVSSEAELDQFIGKLISKAGRFLKRSPFGRALGGALKSVARVALPAAGAALGSIVPGVGTAIGGTLASAAGKALGLELEGLSPEDREFEIARRFVRLAGDAILEAESAPPNAPPQAVAQNAINSAAQKHAPGLVGGGVPGQRTGGPGMAGAGMAGGGPRRANRGTWVRRGRVIILVGV